MKKILKPRGDCPPETLEEIARLLAGPKGTVEFTPDGWVYENPVGAANDMESLTPKERHVIDAFIAKATQGRPSNPEAEAHLRSTLEANVRSPYTGWREIIADMAEGDIK